MTASRHSWSRWGAAAPLSRWPGRHHSCPCVRTVASVLLGPPSHPVITLADLPFVFVDNGFSLLLPEFISPLLAFPANGRRVSYPPGLVPPDSTHHSVDLVPLPLVSRRLGSGGRSRVCSINSNNTWAGQYGTGTLPCSACLVPPGLGSAPAPVTDPICRGSKSHI